MKIRQRGTRRAPAQTATVRTNVDMWDRPEPHRLRTRGNKRCNT